ncbi:hypothetical protein C1645_831885 [Glomus cerebriforme]|uniref:Uncharacterized protein n=1 Tax=Glomus cerebriforme TaxID=658196 RepID=A0A397SGM4_9GLOM|nr:hypothetical protein C1645_831885 [Glomus cerebriforme]
MESLYDELKVKIFRYVNTLMSLILLDRSWYSISQDAHARVEWLIYKYVMQFGTQDHKLIEMKMRYKMSANNIVSNDSWATSLELSVFTKLMTEAHHQLKENIAIKGNDMELFHFLTAAVLIYPKIVKYWKQIGYQEICRDLNDIVMKGLVMLLFPQVPPTNWICPTPEIIAERLKGLNDLGFKLNDDIISDTIKLFESRFDMHYWRENIKFNLYNPR